MAKKKTLRDQYNDALKTIRESEEYSSSTIKQREAMEKMLDDEYKKAAELESLKQEEANIQALEEKKAQEEAKRQQIAAKRLEQLKSIPSDLRGLEAMRRSNSAYVFGGGTIGDVFGYKTVGYGRTGPDGKYIPPERVPVLKPQYQNVGVSGRNIEQELSTATTGRTNKKKIAVLPAGAGSRQELRYLKESAEAKGIPWVEAPVKYTRGKGTSERDRRDQFYSPTGQPMGTLLGSGAYGGFGGGGPQSSQRNWSNYVAPVGPKNPNYYPQQRGLTPKSAPAPQPMPRPAISGPIGSTGFGERVATEEEEASGMFGGYFGSPFGRIQFPFANY